MEAILIDIFEDLDRVEGKRNIHSISPRHFDILFPFSSVSHPNVVWIEVNVPAAFCCGRASRDHLTGIIFNAQENNQNSGMWNIEGLTALHIIANRALNIRTFSYSAYSPKGSCFFTPGLSFHQGPGNQIHFTFNEKYPIDEIQAHPEFDICLFKGQCPSSIGRLLDPNMEIFTGEANNLLHKKVSILHYPSTSNMQRKNLGILDTYDPSNSELLYRVNALRGSSGSPVSIRMTSVESILPQMF